MAKWAVLTKTVCGGFENVWHDGVGDKMTFNSKAEADAELTEFLADVADAVDRGDMRESYDRDDYAVVCMEE